MPRNPDKFGTTVFIKRGDAFGVGDGGGGDTDVCAAQVILTVLLGKQQAFIATVISSVSTAVT